MQAAPKDLKKNIRFRKALLDACGASNGEELRNDVIARCAEDPVFFFDSFIWTYAVKDSADRPNVPFILYDFQADVVRKMDAALGKHSLLIEKSRDLGLSWVVTTMFLWRWIFRPLQSFLMASRKESLVDERGNPDCLFWKMRFALSMLPPWLRPPMELIEDRSMHLGNLVNGSSIDGESTQGNVGRGGRRTAILLDEFAAVECGEAVLTATHSATNCRLFVSTPQGASGAFYDTRNKLLEKNPDRVIRLHWSQHPLKAQGLYRGDASGNLEILDKSIEYPPDYDFVRDGKLRSLWYDEMCNEASSDTEIAAELDINYEGSAGGPLIKAELLSALLTRCKKPIDTGELSFDESGNSPKFVSDTNNGRLDSRLSLWCPLDARGRPPESDYVISADVAHGSGSKNSSSSVLSVADKKSKSKVAVFKSNSTGPHDLAKYAVAMCKWFHGAILIPEVNGPGGAFRKCVMKDLRYRNVWYSKGDESSKLSGDTTESYGWQSNKEKKRLLLTDYIHALVEGRFYNPSAGGVSECREYVFDATGAVVHDKSRKSKLEAEADHSDELIADALLWRVCDDGGAAAGAEGREFTEFPVGSFGWRREQFLKKQKQQRYY